MNLLSDTESSYYCFYATGAVFITLRYKWGANFTNFNLTQMKTETQSITFNREEGELAIKLENFNGARLQMLQKALLLGIEEIGSCERRGCDELERPYGTLVGCFID